MLGYRFRGPGNGERLLQVLYWKISQGERFGGL